MEMNSKPYTLGAGIIARSAAVTTVETPSVPSDNNYICLSVAVFDNDHAIGGHVEVGIKDGMAFIPVRSQTGAFPSKTSMNIEFPFILTPGQKVYASLTTPHAGDHIEIIAHGFLFGVGEYEERASWYYSHFGRHRHNFSG